MPETNEMPEPGVAPLAAEDKKLVTLARATRVRTGSREGAAVRDLDGRTYAAATVDLPSLQLSAIGGCIAMAVASGAQGLEAVVLLSDDAVAAEAPADQDLAVVRDFAGTDVLVHVADARGRMAFALRG